MTGTTGSRSCGDATAEPSAEWRELLAHIAHDHAVVLVGSGVSVAATGQDVASWKGLLDSGIEFCAARRPELADWSADARRLIRHDGASADQLIAIAEDITDKLGGRRSGDYANWLADTIGRLQVQDRGVLDAIAALGLPIITTNYDGLLEDATGRAPITWRDGIAIERLVRERNPGVVFHLHGYWKQPESVILGVTSYDEILADERIQVFVRGLVIFKSLLMVGVGDGATDPNLSRLRRWMNQHLAMSQYRHYRLVTAPEHEAAAAHADARVSVLTYGGDHSSLEPSLRGLHPRRALARFPSIAVAILMSGDLAYVRGIEDGFRAALGQAQIEVGYRIRCYPSVGPSGPIDEVRAEWSRKIDALASRARDDPPRYVVTIGTQAAAMYHRHCPAALRQVPHLFVGVTDPVEAGLVDRLRQRADALNICGVTYGTGAEGLASLVRDLFPERAVIFFYRAGVPQDEALARSLSRLPELSGRLRIVRTPGDPTLEDLSDADAAYFSWYTLENMLEQQRGLDLLRSRMVLATTRIHVETPGLAVADVSADDEEVGRQGADLLLRALRDGLALGSADIVTTPLYYRLNMATAAARGLQFEEDVVKRARDVFRS